ncbi:MAG: VOC family protein, partial [Acidobacteriia bacterium]|nr:VOC family protein [Terriglobia bacterium]
FYKNAFGAIEVFRVESADGTLFAEMSVQGARFFVADESASHGNFSPASLGGTSVRIDLLVADPDAVQARAVAAGAREISPVAAEEVGPRMGRIEDPFGHCWLIGSHWTGQPGGSLKQVGLWRGHRD